MDVSPIQGDVTNNGFVNWDTRYLINFLMNSRLGTVADDVTWIFFSMTHMEAVSSSRYIFGASVAELQG